MINRGKSCFAAGLVAWQVLSRRNKLVSLLMSRMDILTEAFVLSRVYSGSIRIRIAVARRRRGSQGPLRLQKPMCHRQFEWVGVDHASHVADGRWSSEELSPNSPSVETPGTTTGPHWPRPIAIAPRARQKIQANFDSLPRPPRQVAHIAGRCSAHLETSSIWRARRRSVASSP